MTLSATELAAMRSDANALLPDTCELLYVSTANDGMGGVVESWVSRGTISCRMAPASFSRDPSLTASRLDEGDVWVLTLAGTQTIAETDRCIHNSSTFSVGAVNASESNLVYKRAYLRRLQ